MVRALTTAALLVVLLAGAGTRAQTYAVMDMIGYLFESDNAPGEQGFPPSDAGDVLAGLGFIDNVSLPLTWSTDEYEYTWVLSDLVSTGAVDLGNGLLRISYVGGTLDVVADRYADAGYTAPFYGVEPPAAGAWDSFGDGAVYLHGTFTYFTMTFNPDLHVGNFEGHLVFELGPDFGGYWDELAEPDGFAFAGVIDAAGDATVPQGYDLEADGHIYFDPTIPTETSSWGHVKNLYR